jgi:hypothetical protein
MDGENYDETQMDLHNNEIGRNVGRDLNEARTFCASSQERDALREIGNWRSRAWRGAIEDMFCQRCHSVLFARSRNKRLCFECMCRQMERQGGSYLQALSLFTSPEIRNLVKSFRDARLRKAVDRFNANAVEVTSSGEEVIVIEERLPEGQSRAH